MKRKCMKSCAVLMVFLLILSMFAGCGGDKAEKQDAGNQQKKAEEADKGRNAGEPLAPAVKEQLAGTYRITPELIEFQEPVITENAFDHVFEVAGDRVFAVDHDKMTEYLLEGKSMTQKSEVQLDTDYEEIAKSPDGMLYLSQGVFEGIGMKDGSKTMETSVKGNLVMHPSGKWGLTSWVSSDMQKVTNSGDTMTAQPWLLTGLNDDAARKGKFSNISKVAITDEHIFVAGNIAGGDNDHCIGVYDFDGNELMMLGGKEISDPDNLGSVNGIVETGNGIVAIDGNMRTLQFWKKDGTHIGKINVSDLLGVDYPWLSDMVLMEDGSILLSLTQDRKDSDTTELLFYRIKGF